MFSRLYLKSLISAESDCHFFFHISQSKTATNEQRKFISALYSFHPLVFLLLSSFLIRLLFLKSLQFRKDLPA